VPGSQQCIKSLELPEPDEETLARKHFDNGYQLMANPLELTSSA
jgi:hypothetical protein